MMRTAKSARTFNRVNAIFALAPILSEKALRAAMLDIARTATSLTTIRGIACALSSLDFDRAV
jgi:hypothetical protein